MRWATPTRCMSPAGRATDDGSLDVAVVANADMVAWLAWAAAHGLDATPVVPAGLLLPRPEEGFARGDDRRGDDRARQVVGVSRSMPSSRALLIGDAAVAEVPMAEVEAALIAALDAPPLDLRQGVFARRKRRAIDWGLVRRAAVLAGLILLLALVISLVRIAKLRWRTDAAGRARARRCAHVGAGRCRRSAGGGRAGRARGGGGRRRARLRERCGAAVRGAGPEPGGRADRASRRLPTATVRATIGRRRPPTTSTSPSRPCAAPGRGATTTPAASARGRQSIQVTVAPR